MSGIFAYAVSRNVVADNPAQKVKMVKTAPPQQTKHATLIEVLDILDAIADAAKAGSIPSITAKRARAAIALMYFGGLRPAEARGARWEDLEPVYNPDTQQFEWRFTPRHDVWRRHITGTKTPDSVKPIPVIEPLLSILRELREAEGSPQSGWMLKGLAGRPLNLDYLAREHIVPALKAKGIAWPTYYAMRRGAGTEVTARTKDPLAAKGLLRHSNVATTQAHYIKDVPENTRLAMQLIEQRTLALMKKRAEQAESLNHSANIQQAGLSAGVEPSQEFSPNSSVA